MSSEFSDEQIHDIPLSDLLLDTRNPRFAASLSGDATQNDVLSCIVKQHGVTDLLSSLAVNGYFHAEPVVCQPDKQDSGKYVVVEGNRRLAACLILIGDARAEEFDQLTKKYASLHERSGSKPIDPIPAVVFDRESSDKDLLSYLGVRHIASSQPWDSFAKAFWINRIVMEEGVSTESVAEMIGDQHQTVTRLLEGFRFVEALIDSGEFDPADSQRRGRGTNVEYPFSWVYTILGYNAVREYLGIGSKSEQAKEGFDRDALQRGRHLLTAMFGNRTDGRSSALTDSRQLGKLAAIFSDPEKIQYLRSGKSVSEIEQLTRPIGERIEEDLYRIRDTLRHLDSELTEQEPDGLRRGPLIALCEKIERLARSVKEKLGGG